MAEAVVSFAVERLADLLVSEANNLLGLGSEINDMNLKLQQVQNFLKDADEKQIEDERLRRWVSRIRKIAYCAEDVVETLIMEVESRKQKSGFKELLGRFARIYSERKLRLHFSKQIDVIKSELIAQSTSLQIYGITNYLEGETSNSQVNRKSRRILVSHDHEVEEVFVGREEAMLKIISYLKNEGEGYDVVSICGMGGTGKTALAERLYNHVQVRDHFEGYAWVVITQQIDTVEVFRGVLRDLLPANRKRDVLKMDDVELVEELNKVQHEKNCLIVFDDIWTVDAWKRLQPAFPVGRTTCNSKILLTTRNLSVAKIGVVYEVPFLTEEESWQLFRKKSRISEVQEKNVAYEMEYIGRGMVKRCRGSPLAISLLGGFLRRKSLEKWKMIMDFSADDNIAGHILGWSYDSLPPRLKYCFLCLSIYKEDEVIETRELYMIWMAEGLISVEDKAEGEMMFDVAERYLDEMANLSLVQIEDSMGSKKRTCRVHDLIRDFCLYKVKEEDFMSVIHLERHFEDESYESTLRRLFIYSYADGDESKLKPYNQSHIRSVFVRKADSTAMGVWPDKILSLEKFKVLRVLTVNGYEVTIQNIKNISELVFLKYLCLRHCECEFKELPSSIGNLRNLGTLDLRVSSRITIPNVLWKLKSLKHLYLPEFFEECGSIVKLRFVGLNELELIYNYNTVYCSTHDLFLLPNFKVIDGKITLEDNLAEDVVNYIKSKEFVSSIFEGKGGGKFLISILSKYRHDVFT